MNTKYFLNCMAGNVFHTDEDPQLPANYYIGLSTTTPNPDGTGVTEPSAEAGYQRVKLEHLSQPNEGVVTNEQPINFNESTGNWDTVTYFVIYDSPGRGDGNLLMYNTLSTPRSVETATIMTIREGHLKLSVQNPA